MAISKMMTLALRALSYAEPGGRDYRLERIFQSLTHPSLPALYTVWEHHVISKDGYEVPMRIFYPKAMASEELLLFFHGGGGRCRLCGYPRQRQNSCGGYAS